MRTLLISGNDTGIGKTHVTGLLAGALARRGFAVQVVKPIETGRRPGEAGDAETAAAAAGRGVVPVTLFRFAEPIAPLEAARLEGRRASLGDLRDALDRLAPCDWRLVEGAGGLAVPVDEDGSDWTDVARVCGAEAIVLVVEDRLGSINQARLLASHCRLKGAANPIVFLNAVRPPQPEVARSNRAGIDRAGVRCVGSGRVEDLLIALANRAEDAA